MIRRTLVTAMVALLTLGPAVRGQELLPRPLPTTAEPSRVRLGAGDQISVWVRDSEEISGRTYRIEEDGRVRFPMIGAIHVGGLSLEELESKVAEKLKSVIREPNVHAAVTELRSSPVTVTGSVKSPGQFQLRDRITLAQAISLAGGLASDAGHLVRVTRKAVHGKIPLSSARMEPPGDVSIVEEDLNEVLDGTSAAANLTLEPNDVVNVLVAPIIYVMGEVRHPGGLAVARKNPNIYVIEALALSEGTTESAAPQKALILRRQGTTLQNIPVDLKKILAGKGEDMLLRPNDILYVPSNKTLTKTILERALITATSVAAGVTIVRAGR